MITKSPSLWGGQHRTESDGGLSEAGPMQMIELDATPDLAAHLETRALLHPDQIALYQRQHQRPTIISPVEACAAEMSRAMIAAKHGADMTLDDILLKALEGGPITVKDITERLERRVRIRLDRLRVRGVVVREGRGGAHREFTYRLLRPDLAAKAIGEKGGGLSRSANVIPERR